MTGCGRTIG
ncbi:unnamed protein product, partial [Allacma fusca]